MVFYLTIYKRKFKNNLTTTPSGVVYLYIMHDKISEILIIAQEECAEVIQTISKIQRFGLGAEYLRNQDGLSNIDALTQEVGDLLVMVDLLIDNHVLSQNALQEAKQRKIIKLKKWSKIYE